MGITVSIGWLLFVSSCKYHEKDSSFLRKMGKYPSNNKDKSEKKGKRKLEKGLSDRTEDPEF
jgi:hypothetical protein